MKFIKNLIKFIVVLVVLAVAFIIFRPQIDEFLISKGLKTSSEIMPAPVTETFYNDGGGLMYSVNIPATYYRLIPQDDLNRILNSSNGLLQINQNSDGSITCIMTPEVRNEVLSNVSTVCDDNVLAELVNGNIVSIDHNADYSVFYVVAADNTTEAEQLTLSGKLFAIGEVYGALADNREESCRIEIYSASNGTLINTFNSNNIAGDITGDALEHIGDSISERFYDMSESLSPN